MNRFNLNSRLKKLERLKLKVMIDRSCICFPADELPELHLAAEREAAEAVLCPLHGRRFIRFGSTIFQAFPRPAQLQPGNGSWRSKQYQKAFQASFPSDRWPPTEVIGPGPVVRYLLKDGAEIYRYYLQAVYDDENQPTFENGKQLFAGPSGGTILLEPASAIPSEDALSEEEKRWRKETNVTYWKG